MNAEKDCLMNSGSVHSGSNVGLLISAGMEDNECLIFLIWDFIGVLYLICPGIGVCSGCPPSDVWLLSGSVSRDNCGSLDIRGHISFIAGGLFMAHYGLLLIRVTTTVW